MELTPRSKRKLLHKLDRLEKWLPQVSTDTMVIVGEQIVRETTEGNFPDVTSNLKASYHVEAPGEVEYPNGQKSIPSNLLVGGTEKFLNRPDTNQVLIGSAVVYSWWIETGRNLTTGAVRSTRNGVNSFINAYLHWKSALLRKVKKEVSKGIGRA